MVDNFDSEPKREGNAFILQSRLETLEKENEETKKRDEEYKRSQTRSNWLMAVFNGLLVLCSLLAGGIAIWQARIARTTANAALDANKAVASENRAYISWEIGEATPIIDRATKKIAMVELQVKLTNSGTTPTKKAVAHLVGYQFGVGKGIPANFDYFENGPDIHTTLAPRGITNFPQPISLAELQDLRQGNHIFMWGSIVYNDIFPSTPARLSEFCWEFSRVGTRSTSHPNNPPDITDPSTQFVLTPDACYAHNCYDEECPDYQERTRSPSEN